MILRARQFEFKFPRPAVVMGIVNVTPDSFSDGGVYLDPAAAVDHALQLVEEGAEIIDIGGESTRPQAVPVGEAEELRRVMPVLEALAGRVQVLLSIDTYKPGVAREAVLAGAALINDVGAAGQQPAMWKVAGETRAGYVAMHMQGTPATMQANPVYRDVCQEVGQFFENRLMALAAAGLGQEQIALDVGIGFGKTREHNLQLLAGLEGYTRFRRPLVIGVSRKTFLRKWGNVEVQERLPAALGASCWAVAAGAQIIRTHDVRATWQAIRMFEEIRQMQCSGT
jgi:dihydropteroate synthase